MITLECWAGTEIRSTIGNAIAEAVKATDQVRFEFNGVTVIVEGNSRADLIYRDWHRALMGYTDSPVGPHPKEVLSASEQAKDAAIEADNEKRRLERQAEYDAKKRQQERDVEAILSTTGDIDLVDAEGFAKWREINKDPYSAAVVRYAETWARLMQAEIAKGRTVVECADATSHAADTEGITGFMYGCAVSGLAKFWRHGEELRKWHNKEWGQEGPGVVNPAVLIIGE